MLESTALATLIPATHAHVPPEAVRHDGAAVRERPVPHRPRHGVHPGRHLARFQRMQGHEVHFVCADDAHGAAIMLRAEAEGITPQQLVARMAATRPKHLRGFHISFDHWHSTDSQENVELSQDIYGKLKAVGLVYTRTVEQFYDPVKSMFLPDRYIKGECPVCGAKDQYGDACENCSSVYAPTDLVNPYSTISGATPVLRSSEHFFFRAFGPRLPRVPSRMGVGDRLQPEVANKAREWLDGDGDKGLADWDISRDEPYFGIPIPDAPGKYFYVWLDAPIGYLASLRRTWPGRGLTSPPSLGIPTSSRCISSARTSCTTTRCSGRQCSGSLARPGCCTRPCLRARIHHRVG